MFTNNLKKSFKKRGVKWGNLYQSVKKVISL